MGKGGCTTRRIALATAVAAAAADVVPDASFPRHHCVEQVLVEMRGK